MVTVLGVGGWLLTLQPSDFAVQKQADNFAASAVTQMYGGEQSSTQSSGTITSATPTEQVDSTNSPQVTKISETKKYMHAILHTNQGDIKIEFFDTDAPNTVANFTKLAQSGFYNGTKFHRVIAGFMIQGGDPLTKDDTMQARWGTGGPGYSFADEIRANNKNDPGTISMANSGPNTNGSQFFINVGANNFLDDKHTTFGRVVSGMDVVEKIEGVQKGSNDRPALPMVIESVTLE